MAELQRLADRFRQQWEAGRGPAYDALRTSEDPATAALFRTTYGIDGGVPLAGPFLDGPLRDDAGKVRRSALREARLPAE